MATTTLKNSRLRLIFETGVDGEGNPIYRNKNFNNIKTEATADALFAMASVLAPLQEHPLHEVERNDTSSVEQE